MELLGPKMASPSHNGLVVVEVVQHNIAAGLVDHTCPFPYCLEVVQLIQDLDHTSCAWAVAGLDTKEGVEQFQLGSLIQPV